MHVQVRLLNYPTELKHGWVTLDPAGRKATPNVDLWNGITPDGRGIKGQGVDTLELY